MIDELYVINHQGGNDDNLSTTRGLYQLVAWRVSVHLQIATSYHLY
jgi:hypothetical protein